MASPVARVRRVDRPATVERSRTTTRPRATSLSETSPFTRTAEFGAGEDEVAPSMFGSYVVYEKLGEGGMAYVHRAELVGTTGLRKQVALKRLLTESSEDPSLVSSFVHEAQLAAKLQHPNIAQAYELGRIDNTYYIAMEFVPGPTLGQVIAQARNGAGAVPLAIALEILIQIADALDHVHDLRDERGKKLELIHRDISPGNIIISRTGAAKLIDFGIAKVRSGRAQTEAGFIKGKQGYIAPEYTYGQLDHRADLFGLGIVAHELLTARRLFQGTTEFETLANVRHMQVPPPSRYAPGISPQLDAIVLKALDRDPEQRWQSAGEFRVALVAEARRLGLTISGPQIRDWVEWAFQQVPRRLSTRVLNGLEPSMSIEISVEERESSSRLSETVIVDPPQVEALQPPLANARKTTAAPPMNTGRTTTAKMHGAPTPAATLDGARTTTATPTIEVGPSMKARPAMDTGPSMKARPAMDTGPSMKARPAMDIGPSMKARPAMDTGPSMKARPAMDTGPSMKARPAMGTGPSMEDAPTMDAARAMDDAPTLDVSRSMDDAPTLDVSRSMDDAATLDAARAMDDAPTLDGALAATWPATRLATPAATPSAPDEPTPEAEPLPPPPAAMSRKRRAPSWRAPTRWAYASEEPSTISRVMILLVVIAFGLFAADQRWIDIDAWRHLLGA